MWLSDEEYVYQQDIKEKKSAGRGVFHKRGGSKSKKCTLPSDHMTKKEREAMNGEVFSYNPNNWYTWEEFKKMPMEYQVKYVNSLLGKYDCGINTISVVVFGKSESTLAQYFKYHKQMEFINTAKRGTKGINYKFGIKKLKDAMERDLWPNREEIQNGSDEAADSEEPKELTIQEKIKLAQDTVDLYESRGMQITPELINQIYEEKTGMSFALAMNYCEHDGQESESEIVMKMDDYDTDVQEFSIVMNSIDMDIINYVANLFKNKKISVSLSVKQWYTQDEME